MSRTFLRVAAAFVAGPLVAALAPNAAAQTITLPGVLDRTGAVRDGRHQPYWVSHSDCVDQNNLVFNNVVYANGTNPFRGQQLQVWVGPNQVACTDTTARTGTAPQCWLVYSDLVSQSGTSIIIKARDIAGQHLPTQAVNGPGSGTLADCSVGESNPISLGLYFMFVSASTILTGSVGALWTKTTLDIWGPAPPVNVNGTPGETRIHLSWDSTAISSDTKEYQFFCEALTGVADAGLTAAVARPTGTVRQLLEAGAGTGGTTSWFPLDGAVVADAGTGGATSTQTDCVSALPVGAGKEANDTYLCGGVSGQYTDRGVADGLTNGVDYVVSVAAVDEVGNVGLLSPNVCVTPVNVTDFFELYRLMGGKGGGGYCSIAPLGRSPLVPLAALATAIGFVVVRRRRKR